MTYVAILAYRIMARTGNRLVTVDLQYVAILAYRIMAKTGNRHVSVDLQYAAILAYSRHVTVDLCGHPRIQDHGQDR